MNILIPNIWNQKPLEKLASYIIGGDWGKDINENDPEFEPAYCIRGSELKNWEENKGKTSALRNVKRSSLVSRKLIEGDILIEISGGGDYSGESRPVIPEQSRPVNNGR